jgi:Spy/CpxP family protein refolding chaperone
MKTWLMAACLMLGGVARAEGPPEPEAEPSFEQLGELSQHLDLSAEQRRAIRALVDDGHKTAIQARAQLEIQQIDLRRALESGDPDPDKVGAMIDRLSGLEAAMRKARILTLLRIRRLLSPAQRKVLDQAHDRDRLAAPAAPQPPTPPKSASVRGTLVVQATPPAELLIDGKKMGETPLRVDLVAGQHRVEARWEGYAVRQMTVIIRPGETSKIVLSAR